LFNNEFIKIELCDIGTNGDGEISDLGLFVGKRSLLAEKYVAVVSDFGVNLNEKVLEFGFFEREFVEDKIIVEDVFEIGRIIRVIFRISLDFLFALRFVFLAFGVE
jgi:hypothetical protein